MLRKSRLRQKNGFLIKKCISKKIVIFFERFHFGIILAVML